MENTDFRRIDVDSLESKDFEDELKREVNIHVPNEQTILTYVSEGLLEKAVRQFTSPDHIMNDTTVLLISSVFHSVPDSEVATIVQKLTSEESDILLKYVYKAMELCPDVCHSLLIWHSHIFKVFGHGAIIRAMSG